MQHDIHKPLQSTATNLRHTGNGVRIQHTIAENAQPSRSFRDQHRTVRQKSDRPGLLQVARKNHNPQLSMCFNCGLNQKRTFAELRR